jgi:uncharacterized protein (DUF1499 family)
VKRAASLLAPLALLLGCGIVSGDLPKPPAADALLPPCPSAPNCVCSESPDEWHRVEPLAFEGDPAAAMKRLAEVIARSGSKVIAADATEIRAEHESLLFWCHLNIHCRLDTAEKVIQIRSSSRAGYYDFGVNGRRVESIREAFEEGE